MFYEFGKPLRFFIQNNEQFIDYIKKYNGISDCYRTVYNFLRTIKNSRFPRIEYNSAIIDKVFFDFDNEIDKKGKKIQCNSFKNMLNCHNNLLKDNIKHVINFSGRGFHVYAYVRIEEIINKKNALTLFVDKYTDYCDPAVKGDLARISRIPFTMNIKSRNYCIPINQFCIDQGFNFIKNISQDLRIYKSYNITQEIFGKFNGILADFDKPPVKEFKSKNYDNLDDNFTFDSNNMPKCLQGTIENSNAGYHQRYLFYTFTKECGISLESAIKLSIKQWNRKKLYHTLNEERLPHGIYKYDLPVPNPETIESYGLCEKCGGCK